MGLEYKGGIIYQGSRGRNPRKFFFIALMAAVVSGIVWALLVQGPSKAVPSPALIVQTGNEQQTAKPVLAQVLQSDTFKNAKRVSLSIARGDTFTGILRENGIPQRQALDIIERVRDAYDLTKITVGNEFILYFSKDNQTLLGLEYEIADLSRITVTINGDNIEARKQQVDRIVDPAVINAMRQVDLKIRRGDNIFNLLSACGIRYEQIHRLFTSVRREYNLADITPGHPLKVWVTGESPKKLEKLIYEINPVTYLEVLPKDGIFKARTRTRALETSVERAHGTITNSLYESAVKSGLSPEIVMDLTDIFGWDINFFTDIQDGDTFTVLYEKYSVQDRFRGYGRVLAARFVVKGEEHLAVYFDNKGKHGYYDEHGKPIRKLFLKAPLNYRRISSGFSHHRLHPVFHVRRPHLGVDYAAPSGTPVVALGEGRITASGWVRGFGKAITIRHPGGYITHYGHLRGFAKGITKGRRIEQGDVIGYVGATGIATGPHLDFRVQYRGKYTNPLRLEPVNGPTLHGPVLARFKQQSLKELTLLDDLSLDKSLKAGKSG